MPLLHGPRLGTGRSALGSRSSAATGATPSAATGSLDSLRGPLSSVSPASAVSSTGAAGPSGTARPGGPGAPVLSALTALVTLVVLEVLRVAGVALDGAPLGYALAFGGAALAGPLLWWLGARHALPAAVAGLAVARLVLQAPAGRALPVVVVAVALALTALVLVVRRRVDASADGPGRAARAIALGVVVDVALRLPLDLWGLVWRGSALGWTAALAAAAALSALAWAARRGPVEGTAAPGVRLAALGPALALYVALLGSPAFVATQGSVGPLTAWGAVAAGAVLGVAALSLPALERGPLGGPWAAALAPPVAVAGLLLAPHLGAPLAPAAALLGVAALPLALRGALAPRRADSRPAAREAWPWLGRLAGRAGVLARRAWTAARAERAWAATRAPRARARAHLRRAWQRVRALRGSRAVRIARVRVLRAVPAPWRARLRRRTRPGAGRRGAPHRLALAGAALGAGYLLTLLPYLTRHTVSVPLAPPGWLAPLAGAAVLGWAAYRAVPQPRLARAFWPVVLATTVLATAPLADATRGAPGPLPTDTWGGTFEVLSWNVHFAVDGDGELVPDDVLATVRDSGAHVVVLQEVPRGWVSAGGLDLAAWLERRLDARAVWAPAADRQFGNLVLTSLPVVRAETGQLPRAGGTADRSYAAVTVRLAEGETVRVVTTHLEGGDRADTRRAQLAALLPVAVPDGTGADATPTILAGDLNAAPSSPELASVLEAGFHSAQDGVGDPEEPTASSPPRRVDWVLGTEAVEFDAFELLENSASDASDHLPLLARVYLP